MDQVVFFINKLNGSFNRYQIIKGKTVEELQNAIKIFDNNEKSPKAIIITDPLVISAILQKDSMDSLESLAEHFRDSIKDIENSLDNIRYNIEQLEEKIKNATADENNDS